MSVVTLVPAEKSDPEEVKEMVEFMEEIAKRVAAGEVYSVALVTFESDGSVVPCTLKGRGVNMLEMMGAVKLLEAFILDGVVGE